MKIRNTSVYMNRALRCSGAVLMLWGVVAACSGHEPTEPTERTVGQALTSPFLSPMTPSMLGYFKDGNWTLDVNGNGVFDDCTTDRCLRFGQTGDIPLAGDWGAQQGLVSIGVYRPSTHTFILDFNHNGAWDDCTIDRCYPNLVTPSTADDIPVAGSWVGGTHSLLGIFRNGDWYLDTDGDGLFQAGVDRLAHYGATGDRPIVGQWTGPSTPDLLGIFNSGGWTLDSNGDYLRGVCGTTETCGNFGIGSDAPVAGKWHPTLPNNSRVGVYRNGAWYLDANGSEGWDGCTTDDCVTQFGDSTTFPVVGEWPQVQWSTKTETKTVAAWAWEDAAAIVPPGNPSCPKGRAFIALSQTSNAVAVGFPPGPPGLEMVDLDKLGSPTAEILPSRLLTQIGARNYPGGDNQLLHFANDDLVQINVGTYGDNPIYGAIYVWRSHDCGNTWTPTIIKSDDPTIAGGLGRLPSGSDARAAYYRPSTGSIYIDRAGTFNQSTAEVHQLTPDGVGNNNFGVLPGDVVVVGDWRRNLRVSGSGASIQTSSTLSPTAVGRYRAGQWLFDTNGNFIDDGCSVDSCGGPFGAADETPIVGRWTATTDGDRRTQIGTFKAGVWKFDLDSNRIWEPAVDNQINFGGAGDLPIVGAWDTTGLIGGPQRAGVYRASSNQFFLDLGGNGWNGCGVDRCISGFGSFRQQPVSGVWTPVPDFKDGIGAFLDGSWYRDRNADGVLTPCPTPPGDAAASEACAVFGQTGDIPLPGMWGGAFGGFDRAEAYADSSNQMLYITATAEGLGNYPVLLSSNDEGVTWKSQQIFMPEPQLITAVPNGGLYIYGTLGTNPTLISASVNPATNTVTVLSEKFVYAASGAFDISGGLPGSVPATDFTGEIPAATCHVPYTYIDANNVTQGACADDRPRSGSLGIAGLGHVGSTDVLLASYPVLRTVNGIVTEEVKTMRLDVTAGAVTTTDLGDLSASSNAGMVMQATTIQGPFPSNQAAMYWMDTTAASFVDMPTAQVSVRAKVFSLAGTSIRTSSLITLSQSNTGAPRTWTGAGIVGDYQKGASYLTSDGVINYFAQWIEPDPATGTAVHSQILSVHP